MKRLFTIAGAALACAAVMLPVTAAAQADDAAARAVPSTVGSAMKYDHTDLSAFELSRLLPVDARQEGVHVTRHGTVEHRLRGPPRPVGVGAAQPDRTRFDRAGRPGCGHAGRDVASPMA